MQLNRLDWDSTFFGLEVWLLSLEPDDTNASLTQAIEKCPFDVVYVFYATELRKRFDPYLSARGAFLADNRITFRKVVASARMPVQVCRIDVVTPEVRKLAYESGYLSRFRKDPGFRRDFERLYDRWVDRAVESARACIYGVPNDGGKLGGFITTEVTDDGLGKIGLLATDRTCRGQGIGTQLLAACDAFYSASGADCCEVVTQEENHAACRLYEKNGYTVFSKQTVWHVWKKLRI